MVQSRTRWTAEMVRAIPEDGNRYEVIDGDLLVSPGPSWLHQRAVFELVRLLGDYLRVNRVGFLLGGPAEIEFNDVTLVQPDLFVVPHAEGRAPSRWEDVRKLLLVVEVISPSSARTDRLKKRYLYLDRGVPEYWVVDVDAQLIERWRPGDSRPELVADSLVWHPENAVQPFVLDLGEYFREAGAGGE